MTKNKLFLAILAFTAFIATTIFIATQENTLVFHPKGIIAQKQFNLIILNLILMLIILIPTFVWLIFTIWKYRTGNSKSQSEYEPEKKQSILHETLLWVCPTIIIAIMAPITWKATHRLDPYRRLESDIKELTIQVVALDWKWLFIYPEQKIATINYVQFPERTPIRFELVADGSPMNSFWIPQLSGQIYCMTGMVTPLHVMADGSGVYSGKAAEINGEGYAKMTFVAESTSQVAFESWISHIKESSLKLDEKLYKELLKPSIDHPVEIYSDVDKNLFNNIVMKVYQL